MAWAIEMKVIRKARLLAIYDIEGYSKKLVRYFKIIGFKVVKEVGSSPIDLFLRLIWGCLLYTSPSPRDLRLSRMPSSA